MGLSFTTALRVGATLAAISVLSLGGVAYARECDRAARDAAAEPPAVLIVMDASKSMAKPVGGGEAGSRLDAAKRGPCAPSSTGCLTAHASGCGSELAVALRALAARAARTYRPTGTAVRGGATDAAAAEIGTGRYLDRIGADGERRYAIELRTGQRLAAAAVVSRTCPITTDRFTGLLATSLDIDLFEPGASVSVVARSPRSSR